jgi:hypothetical protein
MKTKHTPGPWVVHCSQRFDGEHIFFIRSIDDNIAEIPYWSEPYQNQMEANAKLIAAAPDLLKACKEVVQWHREHDSGEGELFGQDFVTTCIAAISKA